MLQIFSSVSYFADIYILLIIRNSDFIYKKKKKKIRRSDADNEKEIINIINNYHRLSDRFATLDIYCNLIFDN